MLLTDLLRCDTNDTTICSCFLAYCFRHHQDSRCIYTGVRDDALGMEWTGMYWCDGDLSRSDTTILLLLASAAL